MLTIITAIFMKNKAYVESLKNVFANMCLRYLRLIWRPGFNLSSSLVLKMSGKEDLEDFEAMTEETDFFTP